MGQENVATSRRILEEAFGEGDLEVIDEVCAENFVNHDPMAGDQDRETVKQTIASYREAFPDLSFTIEDALDCGDKVVLRWTGRGTFEHELMGMQPTGERGEPVQGITIDRYEGGKLAESWSQWDTLQFMRDIGALPEQAAAAQREG
jgi:predicted ester cyclase